MGIRYSQILGEMFYNIGLPDELKDMADTHFTGASHHLKRFHESTSEEHRLFHLHRHRLHQRLMMMLVYKFGDFSMATDPSNRDLNRRETWNPDWTIMVDECMYRKMMPDWRFPVGKPHAADHYLHDEDWLNYFMQQKSCVS